MEAQMPGPHPKELRKRVVDAWVNGEGSFVVLAERFKVGEASVNRWVALHRRTGDVEPKAMGGGRRKHIVDERGEAFIRDTLQAVADSTLVELSAAYLEEFGVVVSHQTMSDTVRRLGLTRKRGSSVREPLNDRNS